MSDTNFNITCQPQSVFCWQYSSLSDCSSSIRALFWFSSTATLFSRHLMYSFFFLLHSRAASLFFSNLISLFLAWSSPAGLFKPPLWATTKHEFKLSKLEGFGRALRLTRYKKFLPALRVLHNRTTCCRIGHRECVNALASFATRNLNSSSRYDCKNK